MTKEIKKCFNLLRLPYSASLEDLDARERELTNDYLADTEKTGIDHNEDIAFVKIARDKVYEYMVNKKGSHAYFDAKLSDVGTMLFILSMLIVSVVACLLALVL